MLFRSPLYQSAPEDIPADLVVFINAKESLRDIYDDLREAGFRRGENMVLVGDALAPRDLQFAIAEGHRQARAFAPGPVERAPALQDS